VISAQTSNQSSGEQAALPAAMSLPVPGSRSPKDEPDEVVASGMHGRRGRFRQRQ
jgi:hypothetical protein